jgi:RNA-binding protein
MPDPDRLTSRQRAHLRSLAHGDDAHVRVGKEGLTEGVLSAIEEAFNTRELLKIRIHDTAERQPEDVAHEVADRVAGCRVVQTMGWTATLYRPHPDEPRIELPKPGGRA